MAATIPGTPATVSRNIILLSVMPQKILYNIFYTPVKPYIKGVYRLINLISDWDIWILS